MNTKQHAVILYTALAITFGIASFYFLKHRQIRQRLDVIEKEQTAFQQQRALQEQLLQIDSMLVAGENYQEALQAYSTQLNAPIEDDFMGIELRVALTKKLQQLHYQNAMYEHGNASEPLLDSLAAANAEMTMAKQQVRMDSIGFALEKAKVQLARMKQQLGKSASGTYLTFSTSKGTTLHYVGAVKEGKANGYGVAILSSGSRYEGQWKDNHRHGEGNFYWPDGERYEGSFKNDKRSGNGTYYWPNGERFVGLWEDDARTGEGVFYGKKGDVVASGLWEGDELVAVDKPTNK